MNANDSSEDATQQRPSRPQTRVVSVHGAWHAYTRRYAGCRLAITDQDFERGGNMLPTTHTHTHTIFHFQHTHARMCTLSHTLLPLCTCTGSVGATHEEVPFPATAPLHSSCLHWAGILGIFWPSLTCRHFCRSPTEERRCRSRSTGINKSNDGEGKQEKTANTELKMKNKSAFLAGTTTPPRVKKINK